MEIQLNTVALKQFLKRCYIPNLIEDLVIVANDGKLTARFGDSNHVIYGEVYETSVDIKKDGVLKITELKKLIDVMNRVDTDAVKIMSTDKVFVITNGVTQGKFRTEMFQASDAEIIASYSSIKDKHPFDKNNMTYTRSKFKYDKGIEVKIGMLNTLIADQRAFEVPTFTFNTKKTKKYGTQLRCSFENQHTGSTFHRTITDTAHVGEIDKFPTVTYGGIFIDVVKALNGDKSIKKDSNDVQKIYLYFHDMCMLITDNKSYYYNISTAIKS